MAPASAAGGRQNGWPSQSSRSQTYWNANSPIGSSWPRKIDQTDITFVRRSPSSGRLPPRARAIRGKTDGRVSTLEEAKAQFATILGCSVRSGALAVRAVSLSAARIVLSGPCQFAFESCGTAAASKSHTLSRRPRNSNGDEGSWLSSPGLTVQFSNPWRKSLVPGTAGKFLEPEGQHRTPQQLPWRRGPNRMNLDAGATNLELTKVRSTQAHSGL
jgi:hypothetical protein